MIALVALAVKPQLDLTALPYSSVAAGSHDATLTPKQEEEGGDQERQRRTPTRSFVRRRRVVGCSLKVEARLLLPVPEDCVLVLSFVVDHQTPTSPCSWSWCSTT